MTINRQLLPANNSIDQDEIATPSLITPLHVQDRETSKVAGAPRAWRKMTHLESSYQQERLGAKDSGIARDRFDAGNQYTKLWDCAQSAGRDSTASFDAGGYGGSGLPLTEAQASAIQRLVRIEMHLGRNDRAIIRGVCAFGDSPLQAMQRASLSHDVRVSARLCEALDALLDAMERTAKSKKR